MLLTKKESFFHDFESYFIQTASFQWMTTSEEFPNHPWIETETSNWTNNNNNNYNDVLYSACISLKKMALMGAFAENKIDHIIVK